MTPSSTPLPKSEAELVAVADGSYFDPHSVLGFHPNPDGVTATVRVRRPLADDVTIVTGNAEYRAVHEHAGVWYAIVPVASWDYRVRTRYGADVSLADDPYRHQPTVGELDLHLIREGRHEELWHALGARVLTVESTLGDVHGTAFSVWAPNAQAVRVVGDFNGWDGRSHAMRSLGSSGVWELFVPGVGAGQRYKFQLRHPDGAWREKADPLARGTEVPPATASIVVDSNFTWSDDEWLADRSARDPHTGAISIYEVHLGSWRPGLSYRDLASQLTDYVVDLGYTHVEFLPVAEHPFGGSWGYQVTGYYAPTSRFGSPDDFRFLVDSLHRAGIGVILDWVPAHFPKDEWALARFDGTALYEHPDPFLGEHPDWGTYIFNFGRNEVRNFLVANAVYWLQEFHIDGLRVDAVASMLYLDYSREAGQWRPNQFGGRENLDAIQFLQEANATAYRRAPGIMMIAEESTAWPGVTAPTSGGGLGFGLKWNMGWMNDTLRYLAESPVNRRYHHGEITFSMVYAYSERYILPISHDEVVHGKGSLLRKMPGDDWQQHAGVRALFTYQWSHPGKQLTFMGTEFAQGTEWNESTPLDWYTLDYPSHQGVQKTVRELNRVYREHPALWKLDHDPAGFQWLDASDGNHNTLSYIRRDGEGNEVVVVVNFAGVPHEGYRIGLPQDGTWREVFNSDDLAFGGSGVVNSGPLEAERAPCHGQAHSVSLRVPPLGGLFLVRQA
ncbi:1,4-alpha-glucan branching protein GlgB [Rarobacter faecitabidus]|uniref:1,4-alpha-glucan branching enzyme GlgB n=2 Tax=Rarobacter faecitabidus TaxID=13243 RepID=A0A542ZX24_RARFA|nr:1,4-alpha-glucan branching enzyme [Rarobacter faecitabidus]